MSKVIDFPNQRKLSNPNDKVLVTAFSQAIHDVLNEHYPRFDTPMTAIEAHAAVTYVLEEFLGIEHVKTQGFYCCGNIGPGDQEGEHNESR
jgi:hypothetical protein